MRQQFSGDGLLGRGWSTVLDCRWLAGVSGGRAVMGDWQQVCVVSWPAVGRRGGGRQGVGSRGGGKAKKTQGERGTAIKNTNSREKQTETHSQLAPTIIWSHLFINNIPQKESKILLSWNSISHSVNWITTGLVGNHEVTSHTWNLENKEGQPAKAEITERSYYVARCYKC